jgi:ribosomal protein S9
MNNGKVESVVDAENGRLKIKDVATVLGDLHIVDPNLPTSLNVTVTYPKGGTLPDMPAIQAALSKALTYLNNLKPSSEIPDAEKAKAEAKREISYGKLLYVVPLPVATKPGAKSPEKPDAPLKDIDEAPSGAAPALPKEADVKPYEVTFVFTLQSGLSQILSKSTDKTYKLGDFERLSLSGVERKERSDG